MIKRIFNKNSSFLFKSFDHLSGMSSIPSAQSIPVPEQQRLATRLNAMRSACRYFMQETPYGAVLTRTYASGIVGTDIAPKLPKEISRAKKEVILHDWKKWCRLPDFCDYSGQETLHGMLTLALNHLLCDGEIFFRLHQGNDTPLTLELIDPIRVPTFDFANVGKGTALGVEHDDKNKVTAYLIWDAPMNAAYGATYFGNKLTKLPANDVLHWFLPDRLHAVRGVPLVWAIISLGSNLNSFSIAASKNAEIISKRLAKITSDPDSPRYQGDEAANPGNDVDGYINDELSMAITWAPFGTDIEIHDGKFPSDVSSFMRPLVNSMAASMGVSSQGFAGDYGAVNFSAGRLSRLEQDVTMVRLHSFLVSKVLRPVWIKWLAISINRNTWPGITKRDFDLLMGAVFNPPPSRPADQRAEALANKINLENGTTCARWIVEDLGFNFDDLQAELETPNEVSAPPKRGPENG